MVYVCADMVIIIIVVVIFRLDPMMLLCIWFEAYDAISYLET